MIPGKLLTWIALRRASIALWRGKLARQAMAAVLDGESSEKGLMTKLSVRSAAPIAAEFGNMVIPSPEDTMWQSVSRELPSVIVRIDASEVSYWFMFGKTLETWSLKQCPSPIINKFSCSKSDLLIAA